MIPESLIVQYKRIYYPCADEKYTNDIILLHKYIVKIYDRKYICNIYAVYTIYVF